MKKLFVLFSIMFLALSVMGQRAEMFLSNKEGTMKFDLVFKRYVYWDTADTTEWKRINETMPVNRPLWELSDTAGVFSQHSVRIESERYTTAGYWVTWSEKPGIWRIVHTCDP